MDTGGWQYKDSIGLLFKSSSIRGAPKNTQTFDDAPKKALSFDDAREFYKNSN